LAELANVLFFILGDFSSNLGKREIFLAIFELLSGREFNHGI
jgi:hypothetical protein